MSCPEGIGELPDSDQYVSIEGASRPRKPPTILGHSTIAVTMDRYGHLFPDELDRLADGLDVAYRTAFASSVSQSAAVPTRWWRCGSPSPPVGGPPLLDVGSAGHDKVQHA
jgi:hypothetical protein